MSLESGPQRAPTAFFYDGSAPNQTRIPHAPQSAVLARLLRHAPGNPVAGRLRRQEKKDDRTNPKIAADDPENTIRHEKRTQIEPTLRPNSTERTQFGVQQRNSAGMLREGEGTAPLRSRLCRLVTI